MLPFRLLVITDWRCGEEELLRRLARALEAGPGLAIQHRNPQATARTFWHQGQQVRALCDTAHAPLFVNGRLDVALGLEANLHLPSRGLRASDVRAFLPAGRWLSVAVHDVEEARNAKHADLALVSPVFPPNSKAEELRPPLGPAGFEALAGQLRCPSFALGGLSAERAPLVKAAGYAVISAVLEAPDPKLAAQKLLAGVPPPGSTQKAGAR